MGICVFIKFSVIDVRKKPFEAKGEVLLTNIQFVWRNHDSTNFIKKQYFPFIIYNYIDKKAHASDFKACAFGIAWGYLSSSFAVGKSPSGVPAVGISGRSFAASVCAFASASSSSLATRFSSSLSRRRLSTIARRSSSVT